MFLILTAFSIPPNALEQFLPLSHLQTVLIMHIISLHVECFQAQENLEIVTKHTTGIQLTKQRKNFNPKKHTKCNGSQKANNNTNKYDCGFCSKFGFACLHCFCAFFL